MNKSFLSVFIKQNKYTIAFCGIGVVYFFNLFLDVMDVDAAQYASISREMLENKSFLEVYHRHQDYLDKPPLLFWLSSLSFYIFGIHNFAYKLPSMLILILGIYSTYRFAALWYNQEKARLAALILASSQALLLITNDVRTDGLLTGFTIFSIWQLSAFLKENSYKNLVLAAIGIAGSMLSKGPIGLVIPALALGGHLIFTRNWKDIFKPQWLLMLLIVGILLIPMCIGLYNQFDLHPEKTAYGLKSPSGLRFYFWTQSFGRITGEIYWNNNKSFFYFFHTILWDFQPWVLIFIVALVVILASLIKSNTFKPTEYITLFGFLLSFVALSKSNYKLPHYIFPLFPFAAVMTAHFLYEMADKKPKILKNFAGFQFGLMSIFFIILGISFLFFFPPSNWFHPIFLVLSVAFYILVFLKEKNALQRVIFGSVIAFIYFGINTSTYFYPNLLKFQSTAQAGKYLLENKIPTEKSYFYKEHGHALDFYAQRIVQETSLEKVKILSSGSVIFTTKEGSEEIMKQDSSYRIIKTFDEFHVTALKLPFLLESSRKSVLKQNVLLEKP